MADPDGVRRAYDDLAETYAAERSTDRRATAILEAFLDGSVDRVLDAGCGQGEPVLTRIEETASGVGLDISREMLRLADEAVAGPLVQGDMTRLPFVAGAVDAVVAYWSLIHVPLAEHSTAIEEFARVLRPGGRVLLCEGPEEWVGENPDWLDSGVGMAWEVAGVERTREQLHEAGFRVTESWGAAERLADEDDSESSAGEGDASDDDDGDERDTASDDGDGDGDDTEGDDDPDWVFLAAELAS